MPEETATLLDDLDKLAKRRLAEIISKVLRRYAAKVKMTGRHFSENEPYKEQFTLNSKMYWMAVHTENQMITWVIHDPSSKLILA